MLTLKWPVQPHWWQSALLHSSSQSTLDNAVKEKELQIHKDPTSHTFVLTMTLNAELEMLWRQTPGKNLDLLPYSTFLPLKTLLRHNREYISLTHTLNHWLHFHKKKLEIWPVNIWLQVDPLHLRAAATYTLPFVLQFGLIISLFFLLSKENTQKENTVAMMNKIIIKGMD